MGLLSLGKQQECKQKYGVIRTSLLKYITPTMIGVIITCIALVTLNFDLIYVYYETSIPLNSLIIIVFLMAMIEAFNNNLNIYGVARFLKKVEEQIESAVVEEVEVQKLKGMLETSAFLVNTQNTFKLIDNLQKYGHPLVTDNDARLIKSKLGFRIRIQRASVSFMGGLLVMLGLIGTFWGLLLTIGAVGEAMDTIAKQAENMGVGDGESGIGGIIQSISAPLQGMGLAFSSSLFGLAGSLTVGFFNYSCSQAQDKAIEDFSRWIDEKIPTVGSEEEALLKLKSSDESEEDGADAEDEEQKEGSVDNEVKTQTPPEFLSDDITTQILYTLKQSTEVQANLSANFEKLLGAQKSIYDLLERGQSNSDEMKLTQERLYENSNKVVHFNQKMHAQMVSDQQEHKEGMETLRGDLSRMASLIDQSNGHFKALEVSMSAANENDLRLASEVSEIRKKIPKSEYEMIRRACHDISQSIHTMDGSLKENVKAMSELAKEGNMQKMSRILKEMQIFWLQMKQNAFDVVGKGSSKK